MSKTLRAKQKEYEAKYADIPRDDRERLSWMCDKFNVDVNIANQILKERERRMNMLYYSSTRIILYQEPQGAKRPRYRILNKSNIVQNAIQFPNAIHVYSPDASYNHEYMKRVVSNEEFDNVQQIICTPCNIEYRAFFPTPKSYNKIETFIAEIGLDRPVVKPDFDNIEKVYADMYNHNVWLDDSLTVDGVIHKFYSILPRVEIDLYYLNAVYNKKQFMNITSRRDFDSNTMSLKYI